MAGAKSGSAADRKSPYIFFNLLTFLNTNNPPTKSQSSINSDDLDHSVEDNSTQLEIVPDPFEKAVPAKKSKAKDEVGIQLIKILKDSAEERRKHDSAVEADEDRLFLLSLVSDMKRVPQHLKLSVKRKLMTVIEEHQERPAATITSTGGYVMQRGGGYQYPSHNVEYSQGYTTTPAQYSHHTNTATVVATEGGSGYSGGNRSNTTSPIFTTFDTMQ